MQKNTGAPDRIMRMPLRGEVYRRLRKKIVRGELPPGAKLKEVELAAALAVSRTPLREALQRLEYDGLVVTRPGYSTRVTTLTITDLEEMYPLISVLEGLAARLAATHLTDSDLARMDELADAMAAHLRHGEIAKLMDADSEFHSVLYDRAPNRRLQRIVRDLRGQLERFEFIFFSSPKVAGSSVARHKRLVAVLRKRDPLMAERRLLHQWKWGPKVLLDMIRQGKLAVEGSPVVSEERARYR